MEPDRDVLEYATPRRDASARTGAWVRGLGLLLLVGGIACAFLGTVGIDNHTQILAGCAVAAAGLIVALLGQILRAVETRR